MPQAQALALLEAEVSRRIDHERQRAQAVMAAQRVGDLEAGAVGQHEVKHEQVGLDAAGQLERRPSGVGVEGLDPLAREDRPQDFGEVAVVLDDHHA